jgi:hypothetical protein
LVSLGSGINIFGSDVIGTSPATARTWRPPPFCQHRSRHRRLGPNGTVARRNDASNPALSGADSLVRGKAPWVAE